MSWVLWDILLPLFLMFCLGLGLGWMLWRWRRQSANAEISQSEVAEEDHLSLAQMEATNIALIEERDRALQTAQDADASLDALHARIVELESAVESDLPGAPLASSVTGVANFAAKANHSPDRDMEYSELEQTLEDELADKARLEQALINSNNRYKSLAKELDAVVNGDEVAGIKGKAALQSKYDSSLERISTLERSLQERDQGEQKSSALVQEARNLKADLGVRDKTILELQEELAKLELNASSSVDNPGSNESSANSSNAGLSESTDKDSIDQVSTDQVSNGEDPNENSKITDIQSKQSNQPISSAVGNNRPNSEAELADGLAENDPGIAVATAASDLANGGLKNKADPVASSRNQQGTESQAGSAPAVESQNAVLASRAQPNGSKSVVEMLNSDSGVVSGGRSRADKSVSAANKKSAGSNPESKLAAETHEKDKANVNVDSKASVDGGKGESPDSPAVKSGNNGGNAQKASGNSSAAQESGGVGKSGGNTSEKKAASAEAIGSKKRSARTAEKKTSGDPKGDQNDHSLTLVSNNKATDSGYVPKSWKIPEKKPDKKSRDKLTLIKGVGPVLEKVLHSTGIYYFQQVALLDEEGIDELQQQIPQFPGRIQRDQWVDQARQLHEEKYGSAAQVE